MAPIGIVDVSGGTTGGARLELVVELFEAQLVNGTKTHNASATAHRRLMAGRERGSDEWTGLIQKRGVLRTDCDTA